MLKQKMTPNTRFWFFIGTILIIIQSSIISFAQEDSPRVYKTANPFITEAKATLNPTTKTKSDPVNQEQIKGTFLHELNKSLYVQSETDIMFYSGRVYLDSKATQHLDLLVKILRSDINRHRTQFPDEKIVMFIDVKGYTDAQGFYIGQSMEERQTQNQVLSANRATQVQKYLEQQLKNSADVVDFQTKGLGEKLPNQKKDLEKNPNLRRSCNIYTLLYAEKYTQSITQKVLQ
jgi:outer membrane protein OmpA-like peptidoglycan-associated protein